MGIIGYRADFSEPYPVTLPRIPRKEEKKCMLDFIRNERHLKRSCRLNVRGWCGYAPGSPEIVISPKILPRRHYWKHGNILMLCATSTVFRNGSPASLTTSVFVGRANRGAIFSSSRNLFLLMTMLHWRS